MGTMDDHGEFDSVSWPREVEADVSKPRTTSTESAKSTLPIRTTNGKRSMSDEGQAGQLAEPVDLGGIGIDGILECIVDTPLKENDGTKDAYVSYLITTHVCKADKSGMALSTLLTPSRPTSNPSRNLNSPSAVASRTLFSSAR